MDVNIILHAGVATGTVLLFATIGEIFAERAGILNLGLEGMMLIGAMSAFSVTVSTGNGTLGLLVDRKSTRLNSSHSQQSRMPSSA